METQQTILCSDRSSDVVRTEDGIIVYNIMIEKLPGNTSREAINRHFSNYGKIKNIEFSLGKTRSKPKSCIVYFQSANAAKAALKRSYVQFGGERLTLKACPSWEQPFEMDAVSSQSNVDEGTTLQSLNDYCLEMVFQQLDLLHQVRLSLCDMWLEQVFVRMICPRLTGCLVLSQLEKFSLWETRQFFRTAGRLLHSIEVTEKCNNSHLTSLTSHVTLYDLISGNCWHVQRLQVLRTSLLYKNFLNALLPGNITELELYDCNLSEENCCSICKELPNLKALGLACNKDIRGVKLPDLLKLQYLSLFGCESLSTDALWDTCRVLKLRYLDVRCMPKVKILYKTLLEYCGELETLRVGVYDRNYPTVVGLPKLKCLDINNKYDRYSGYGWLPDSFYKSVQEHANDLLELKLHTGFYMFHTLVSSIPSFKNLRVLWVNGKEHKIKNNHLKVFASLSELEEINLDSAIRVIDNYFVLLVERCTKLKRMSLRNCWQIRRTFVPKVIAILEKRAKAPYTPLLLLLSHTFFSCRNYHYAQHLVRISEQNPKPIQGLLKEKSIFDIEQFDNKSSNCATQDSDDDSDDYPTDLYFEDIMHEADYFSSEDSSDSSEYSNSDEDVSF